METKELKINVPKGYEIDKKNSTFEKIIFKKIEVKKWRDTDAHIEGFYINSTSDIAYHAGPNTHYNHNLFATGELADAALAAAQISQIMANDKRFGGPVTIEDWSDSALDKYVINRDCINNQITISLAGCSYKFLTFHEMSQAKLFLKENRDLINDYFMISE